MPLTKSEKIWMDGELVDWDDANVHILTHTLHYGCGVFEGIRAYETSRGAAVFRLREHIDYVPTQILTEYFRKRVKGDGGSAIDGVVYPSARRRGERSIVIFASQDDLDPEKLWGAEPLLKLDQTSVKRLRRSRRR